jgi:hypothetical protein
MSQKLCFNKNTFIIGIIIIIIIIIIISLYYKSKYKNIDNQIKMHNLINKKILNIKDKIIQKKQEQNYEYKYKQEQKQEKELEPEKNQEHKLEPEHKYIYKAEHKLEPEHKIEQEHKYIYKPEHKIEQEHKYIYKPEPKVESKVEFEQESEFEQELEKDVIINTKVNFKNSINDRMNDRDELIKYKINDTVQQRDLNVLLNPIYPPLARVERPIFDNLIKMNFDQSTRGSEDTFRLMGYLINSNKNDSDTGGDVWKLFGRQTYRGSSIGEFYVSPVNDHQSDMKIFLKNNMMPKEKIKDIYALPSEVYLDSPFFSKNAYTINELPKSDFNSNYL